MAIGSHKFIIALCIGQQLVSNKVKEQSTEIFSRIEGILCQVHRCLIVLYISTFSFTTIIGAGAGMGMLHSATTGEDAISLGVTVMQACVYCILYTVYCIFFKKNP